MAELVTLTIDREVLGVAQGTIEGILQLYAEKGGSPNPLFVPLLQRANHALKTAYVASENAAARQARAQASEGEAA